MFVDDDTLLSEAFSRSMKRAGYDVVTASSAAEALDAATKRAFKVVVTDLRMPGMDGLTLTEKLSEQHPNTVFLVVTAMPDLDLHRGRQRGTAILATFAKPWDEEEMVDAISRAFELHERRKARVSNLPKNRLSVLLVEDSPADAFLIERFLRMECQSVVEHVLRLGEAEVLLASRKYDVVVTDLSLPDARGLDAIRRIRRAAPHSAVIVLSGLEDDAVMGEALRTGAQEFLVKGQFDPKTLRRTVMMAMERGAYVQELSKLAHYDPLTGLANRRTLRDQYCRSQSLLRYGEVKLGFLSIDLDRFKTINDTMGHEAGDELLVGVADRIGQSVRDHDVVARLGGDEFAVLVTQLVSDDDLSRVADRVVAGLASPFHLSQGTVTITASVGAILVDPHRTDFDSILRTSDRAMYDAKRAGRNRLVLVDSNDSEGQDRERELEAALQKAAEEQTFQLYFQPQCSIQSGKLSGFEAFLRFRHEGAPIPPRRFIPALERLGLIDKVGRWVLSEACAELRRCKEAGLGRDLRMAVNVSEQQFENESLCEQVREALELAAIDPQALELEITESVLMRDTEQTTATLKNLRELGVRVTIDDFGTGYSSLAYLQRFRVNALKIDTCFVHQIQDERSGCVAGAIIGLGHRLNMDIIAEGVESAAQLDALRSQGCDFAQGYFVGPPQPSAISSSPLVAAS